MLSSIQLVLAPVAWSWIVAQIPEGIDLRAPVQVARFAPATLAVGDAFGYSVALDGDTLVVGAPFHVTAGGDTGAAWVFERDGAGAWQEVVELFPAGTGLGFSRANFGHAVAVSGDVLAVGAPYANTTTNIRAGAVLVYERLAGVWTQVAILEGGGPLAGFSTNLGSAVAIDGSTLVAGGFGCDVLACFAGAAASKERVEVHERDVGGPSAWGRTATFTVSFTACTGFGRSVDIEGRRIAAGADLRLPLCTPDDQVRVYERLAGSDGWGAPTILLPPPVLSNFGSPVALSGDLLAVGSLLPLLPLVPTRAASVYQRDPRSGAWSLLVHVPTSATPFVGPSSDGELALQGSLLVAGNPMNFAPGEVSVFLRHLGGQNAFGLAQRFSAEDAMPGDFFGFAVSLAGGVLAVGAPQCYTMGIGTGAVYVYEFPRPGGLTSSAPRLR